MPHFVSLQLQRNKIEDEAFLQSKKAYTQNACWPAKLASKHFTNNYLLGMVSTCPG